MVIRWVVITREAQLQLVTHTKLGEVRGGNPVDVFAAMTAPVRRERQSRRGGWSAAEM